MVAKIDMKNQNSFPSLTHKLKYAFFIELINYI
jgi:hypothetical protein